MTEQPRTLARDTDPQLKGWAELHDTAGCDIYIGDRVSVRLSMAVHADDSEHAEGTVTGAIDGLTGQRVRVLLDGAQPTKRSDGSKGYDAFALTIVS